MATFPLLFTLDSSHRHEVILVSSKTSLSALEGQIQKASTSSPNCTEFMSKYKKAPGESDGAEGEGGGDKKKAEIKVRWSDFGRDPKVWPKATVVTDENWEALLKLIEPSKDVLEVKLA